jgi:hypothetical protein
MRKHLGAGALGLAVLLAAIPLEAAQSANYKLHQTVIGSAGATRSASGKLLRDSGGEPNIGQSQGRTYSVQAGFFNEYFLPLPTPTSTCTPIRSFNGALLDENWVYAAPNPIRGRRGVIHFDLAEAADVDLKIYTTQNQLVISQRWTSLAPGHTQWTWNADNIANGVYILYIKASAEGKSTTVKKKLALVR